MIIDSLRHLKVGDKVHYCVGDEPPFKVCVLKITAIESKHILCGERTFSRKTGNEIDLQLGWDDDYAGARIVERPDKIAIFELFKAFVSNEKVMREINK